MSIEIKLISTSHSSYQKVLELRNEILRKPIGLNIFDEDLSLEHKDVIFVCHAEPGSPDEDPVVVGCVVLRPCPEDQAKYNLRQMAVAADQRGKNIGRQLLEAAETFALEHGVKRIFLNGRTVSSGFYLKCGYKIVSEEFVQLGVPHYAMEKTLK